MHRISFVVDDEGRKTSVLIGLKKHRALWEDFYDALVVRARKKEPRESLPDVETRLSRLRGN
jgi:hypothetical protein